MPAASGKRRGGGGGGGGAKYVDADVGIGLTSKAAAAVDAANASSKRGLSSPSRGKRPARVDAASLDLDSFLNGGFMSISAAPGDEGDDVCDDAGAAVDANKKKKKKPSAAASHKADLEALRTKDPEFFEYLQQADAELLDFNAGDEDESDEEEEEGSGSDDDDDDDSSGRSSGSSSGEEEEDDARSASSSDDDIAPSSPTAASEPLQPSRTKKKRAAVVPSQILRWCTEAKETLSLRAFRCLLQAYRAACHHGEGAGDDAGTGKGKKQKKMKQQRKKRKGSDSDESDDDSDADADAAASAALASGAASNALLLFVLREADGIFRRLLGMPSADEQHRQHKEKAPSTSLDPRSSPRWRKVEPLARSYLGNSLHLLTTAADPGMEAFVLRRLRPSATLLVCSERLQRKTTKAALAVFGSDVSPSPSSASSAAPLQAALFVREAAVALSSLSGGSACFDAALKGSYRAFVRSAKFVTPASAPRLALMSACVVDLYASAPAAASYSAAFGYVRQLAQLVRGALDAKAKEGYRTVYCWQTVSCLELWARLLGALVRNGEGDHPLEPLVFPVTQLLLTSASLVPSLRYAPLHLRLLRAASALAPAASSRGSAWFAPSCPERRAGLDAVAAASTAAAARGKGGGGKGGKGGGKGPSSSSPQEAFLLRASKVSVASPAWQADVAERACEALASALATAPWPSHPAFPEIAAPVLSRLRSFSKNCAGRGGAGDRCRSAVRGLVAAIEANVSWVGARRATAALAPADADGVASFVSSVAAAASSSKKVPPLRSYADLLAQRARDRREMATAAAVRYGGSGGGKKGGGGEFGDEEEEDDDGAERKGEEAGNRRDRRSAFQRDEYSDDDDEEDDDDDEDDDDEDEVAASSGDSESEIEGSSDGDSDDDGDENAPRKRPRRVREELDDDDGETLRDYNPSDSD